MVSVVIPAYNAGKCIARAVDSVLAQSYTNYEIIVVDDGSTDNTAEIVKSFGQKVNYIHQQNAGDAQARNKGIAAAKGDWIAFLDADDQWLPEKLRKQIDVLGRSRCLRWAATNRYQSDGQRKAPVGNESVIRKALNRLDYFPDYFAAAIAGKCPIITSTMMVHKELFQQLGNFESRWFRCADLDMWWRIAYVHPEIGYVPEPLTINYFDADDAVLTERRILTKRGIETRKLLPKHLKLAEQHGCLNKFRPYARKILLRDILVAVYHGFKDDARAMAEDVRELVPSYWRLGIFVLTVFPKTTARIARLVAYIGYLLGFEKQITRRWILTREIAEGTNKQGPADSRASN